MDDQETVDLSALIPEPIAIVLPDGTKVTLNPPKVQDVLRIAQISRMMSDIADIPENKAADLIDRMHAALTKVIPELAGVRLHAIQLNALVSTVVTQGMPRESAELKKRGITEDNAKKDQ